MGIIIEVESLTKDYEVGFWKKKKVRALDGLSLAVERGQIFGFLGGNGAGKTTTIKILMRLLFPTEGTAKILGADISDVNMHSRIGYCPENPYFYDYLTARELMNYFGELFGYNKTERNQRTEKLLTRVGLENKDWDKQLRKFSKGMLQRVGIAHALINDPEVVFFDEPMSGLDPIGRREIRELISDLRENGTTVFMSTHILSDIEALCDNVAILRGGKLAATGKLDHLLEQSGESRGFEIVLKEINAEIFREKFGLRDDVSCEIEPNGLVIRVADETAVRDVLDVAAASDARLVSVQPIKQSLEELFVKETT